MTAQTHIYRIAEISNAGRFFTLNRMAMTTAPAARHNQQAFLILADEVAKAARKIREKQAQLKMPLGAPNE